MNKRNDNIIREVIKTKPNIISYIMHFCLLLFIFVLLFYTMKFFNMTFSILLFELASNNIFHIIALSNILVWFAFYLILRGITNKPRLSLAIVIGIEVVFDIINYVVLVIRGSGITLADIKAVQTALSVSHTTNFSFEARGLCGIVLLTVLLIVFIIARKLFVVVKDNWKIRCVKIISGVLILFALSISNVYKTYIIWDINETYRVLGTPLTLLRMFQDIYVKVPDGYDKDESEAFLKSYESSIESQESTSEDPNIVVIINESFCDYYHIYNEGYTDPIPYFTELSNSNNVISGTVYSSSFGGQTSNIEYEFLTQNSIRILPVGSYMFQQYITKPVSSSLVSSLKQRGYKTSAIHPWESFAYSRDKIYRLFGFDNIKFKNDIEELKPNFNNVFPDDRSTYTELISQINQKKPDEKIFEYVLTVQNHIGFNNPDPNQITYHDDNTTNVYLQLIHESSEALREVIEELEKKDEKYILLFFGDHQPNMDGGNNYKTRGIEHYETPFVIWANYDIEEKHNIKTSTIFLQNYLLEAAGLPKTAMNNYINTLMKDYDAITPMYCIDSNGKVLREEDYRTDDKLLQYNRIDYYRAFDMD